MTITACRDLYQKENSSGSSEHKLDLQQKKLTAPAWQSLEWYVMDLYSETPRLKYKDTSQG